MRKFTLTTLFALLAGCVTINVYFPAAAAQEAADKIISNVIGPDHQASPAPASSSLPPAAAASPQGAARGVPLAVRVLDALVPAASAAESQPDINIQTPQIEAIQSRMRTRYEGTLQGLLDSGAVGYTNDGMMAVRDASKAALSARAQMNSAVADENRDRAALYQQIAVGNGHPEWERQIRQIFARQWIDRAHPGWYYQDASGAWRRK
ncbi:MAG: YdbL family protein [Proteobacteria bacterium]|nr:YdbL family protein [Pseudomonadota bacterium]